ncbi:MAG: hypothetical protein DWQ31_11875 [Planctomycetota bacterium]|nr:MAG: hypothetical protein DWQ31_11875 [Planctomycetota bacterium]REK17632.1 MAG: hypothetical protein DWQ37_05915 [Planctomycetota bacterium]
MHPSPENENAETRRPARWSTVAHVALILAAAVFLRGWQIDHVPGVNGDEAWMGVQAQRFLDGFAGDGNEPVESVQWRTPTGNPINWFLFWPTVLLHTWLPPSIGLLRLPALLSGLAALAVNYWLCGRVFGRRAATISTLLFAVLPLNIAYARFGWDASQSLLATLPVIYLSLLAVREPDWRRCWLLLAAAVQAMSILVHPTNIFVVPVPVFAATWVYRGELADVWRQLTARRLQHVVLALAAAATGLALWLLWPWCEIATRRLITPGESGTFLVALVDLFAGISVYQFIPGSFTDLSAPSTIVYRVFAGALLGAALWGSWRYFRTTHHVGTGVLAAGTLASFAVYFLIAGPEAIRPHFERYGVCLLALGGLALALGIEWWLTQANDQGRRAARWVAPTCAWLLLVGFALHYHVHFRTTGGTSHAAFRTAPVEPKLASLQLAAAHSPDGTIDIVADDWWHYWPLAYLAHKNPRIRVHRFETDEDSETTRVAQTRDTTRHDVTRHDVGTVWWIGFADRARAVASVGDDRGSTIAPALYCDDYAGREVVGVMPWTLRRP